MVAPVTGPVLYWSDSKSTSFYRIRNTWKQAKPYDRPLPFNVSAVKRIAGTGVEANEPVVHMMDKSLDSKPIVNQVKIRAYDEFKGKLGDRAELLVTIAEYDKAIDTVGQLSMALYKVARTFKRGLSRPMWEELRKLRARDVSSTQLGISYGVMPTIQDLYSAVNVLQSPMPDGRIKASSTGTSREVWPVGGGSARYLTKRFITATVMYGAEVRVTNPNLYLANQLGLVNPFTYLTERTPLSFVANWFINLDQFMSVGTDFYGLTLGDAYTSTRINALMRWQWSTHGWISEVSQDNFRRATGITTPRLGFRQLRPWGWRRTANAVSLLANHLKSF